MSKAKPSPRSSQRRPQPPEDDLLTRLLTRFIDPIVALTAAIYSILMVLTFTLTFSIIQNNADIDHSVSAEAGAEMFFAVLGATVAWGLIDGLIQVLLSMLARGEKHRFLKELQASATDEEAVSVIADQFDYFLEPITGEKKRHMIYEHVREYLRDSHPRPVGLQLEDFISALTSALVAIASVIPSLLPLWLMRHNPHMAMHISNAVSFIVLFFLGYRWGVYSGANRWKTGLLLFISGVIIMAIAIPLGA